MKSCHILYPQIVPRQWPKGNATRIKFERCSALLVGTGDQRLWPKAYGKMSRLTTKPTKWLVCPTKTQISMGIRQVWSESSLCARRVSEDPMFLHADSEDFYQTGRMPRLIWVFDGRTCHFVGFVMRRLRCLSSTEQHTDKTNWISQKGKWATWALLNSMIITTTAHCQIYNTRQYLFMSPTEGEWQHSYCFWCGSCRRCFSHFEIFKFWPKKLVCIFWTKWRILAKLNVS